MAKAKAKAKKTTTGKQGATAKKVLEAATRRIRALLENASRTFHAVGLELNKVSELKLHRAAGYSNIEDYAEKEIGISSASAYQYMRVAGAFSAEICALYGVEKLDQALKYVALTPEEDSPREVVEGHIEVTDEDGKRTRKRFDRVTVADLRAANTSLREAKATGKTKRASVPESVARKAVKANRDLDKSVGKRDAAAAVVKLRPSADGAIEVDVIGLPLKRASAALRAVAAAFA
jgi:hypothetical protein